MWVGWKGKVEVRVQEGEGEGRVGDGVRARVFCWECRVWITFFRGVAGGMSDGVNV